MNPRGKIINENAKTLSHITVAEGILSVTVFLSGCREFFRQPLKVFRILKQIMSNSGNGVILTKNLVVFFKGLWLGSIARSRRVDHIHVHWASTTATIGLVASEVSNVPWSFTAHRWDIVDNNLLQLKMRHATFVRFISTSGIELAKKYVSDDVLKKCTVLHMGAPVPEVNVIQWNENETFTILCPANLIPVKGHEYLISAVSTLTQRGHRLKVILAGEGVLRPVLERQVKQLGLTETVVFFGHVVHERLLRLYETGEIGCTVLPSVDLGEGEHEGIPVSLIEAMAHGVPVISTLTGGIPELLSDGAGLLVPPEDVTALADAIENLIYSPSSRMRLGEAGKTRVENEFNIDRIIDFLEMTFKMETKTMTE